MGGSSAAPKAFPSFDAQKLHNSLPEQYFGKRPPPPNVHKSLANSPGPRRVRHAPDHLGRNGHTYRSRAGMLRRPPPQSKADSLLGSREEAKPKKGKKPKSKSITSDLEFEYYKSKLARPRQLLGGVQNITSEVMLRRETRALTEVKRKLPTEAELVESERVKVLQAFFAKNEPGADGKSSHGSTEVRKMMRQQPDFGALCEGLRFKHGESPLSYASEELISESRNGSREARRAVEKALSRLQMESRMRPGAELTHMTHSEGDVPSVNPKIDRGVIAQHTDFEYPSYLQ
eukprot:COSAG05_NODE_2204_length_3399_cov_4.885593_4_plen_289_part_00